MKERVEGELRSCAEVVAVFVPRHFVGVGIECQFVYLVVETDRRNGFTLQCAEKKTGIGSTQLLLHTMYEIYGQHTGLTEKRLQSYEKYGNYRLFVYIFQRNHKKTHRIFQASHLKKCTIVKMDGIISVACPQNKIRYHLVRKALLPRYHLATAKKCQILRLPPSSRIHNWVFGVCSNSRCNILQKRFFLHTQIRIYTCFISMNGCHRTRENMCRLVIVI